MRGTIFHKMPAPVINKLYYIMLNKIIIYLSNLYLQHVLFKIVFIAKIKLHVHNVSKGII